MFTADSRLSDALRAHPELQPRLTALHPAFRRLRGPLLGRALAKALTARGAARLTGLPLERLLDCLNGPGPGAAGAAAPSVETRPAAPPATPGSAGPGTLDLRGLEHPAPVRQVLEKLNEGYLPLRVLHHVEPIALYPFIEARGLRWEHRVHGDHGELCILAGRQSGAHGRGGR